MSTPIYGTCLGVWKNDKMRGEFYRVLVRGIPERIDPETGKPVATYFGKAGFVDEGLKGKEIRFKAVKTPKGYWNIDGDISVDAHAASTHTLGGDSASSGVAGPTTDQRIVRQHSQEMALRALPILLEQGAVVLGTKTAKAPARFEAAKEVIAQLTQEFFDDVYEFLNVDVEEDDSEGDVVDEEEGPVTEDEVDDPFAV